MDFYVTEISPVLESNVSVPPMSIYPHDHSGENFWIYVGESISSYPKLLKYFVPEKIWSLCIEEVILTAHDWGFPALFTHLFNMCENISELIIIFDHDKNGNRDFYEYVFYDNDGESYAYDIGRHVNPYGFPPETFGFIFVSREFDGEYLRVEYTIKK